MVAPGIVEVWIVDRFQRLPPALELELAQRKIAARFIRRPGDITSAFGLEPPLPAAVLFTETDSPEANLASGYLMGLAVKAADPTNAKPITEALDAAKRSVLWWGWRLPHLPEAWPVKLRPMAPSSAPHLAKAIAFQARHHAARLNAAASAPVP